MTPIPSDYDERVYAGVLGKIIGVYLGRPFEQWSHEAIERTFGEVNSYVNERAPGRPPLIVTDDDITGTFTFLRALEDHGRTRDITAEQIGQTWLNYLIERKTILWWGGMGLSTEHTAYMRLKKGIPAPASGSIAHNGPIVAEQIGAQIFIDGWAMVAPGNPALAVELAGKAASVSHDREAIYAAQVVAAMESLAFVERDLERLLDAAVGYIPPDSLIAHMIADIRAWRAEDGDWRVTLRRIQEVYGYERYGGNCHIVPNHAVIILALLYAEDDFQRALMIACTAGYDTDCNAGNVGCLMGIKNGLRGIDASPVDWRAPVADRLLLPTADGGRCISDAVREAQRIAALGRVLAGEPEPPPPPRFSFAFPGSVQGFHAEGGALSNAGGALAIAYHGEARAATPTFTPPDELNMVNYGVIASPTLYPGQTVTARVSSEQDAQVNLFVAVYDADDRLELQDAVPHLVRAGESVTLTLTPEADGGSPIARVGLRVAGAGEGTLLLHALDWDGPPATSLGRPNHNGSVWKKAWVHASDNATFGWESAYRLMSDEQPGLLIQGERAWQGYNAEATIRANLASSFGVAVCVRGLRRYYALLLTAGGRAQLVKLRDSRVVLAETPFDWQLYQPHTFSLTTDGDRLVGAIDGHPLFDVRDEADALLSGAVALVVQEGRIDCDTLQIMPVVHLSGTATT